jgi:hypothetical protein
MSMIASLTLFMTLQLAASEKDYYLSVPALGSIFRVDHVTKQSTLVASGLGIPFYGFFDAAGVLYLPDRLLGVVFKLTPGGQLVPLAAGGLLTTPVTCVADPSGNGMIVSDIFNDRLVRVGFDGSQSLFLDDAMAGGLLHGPGGLAFDNAGNLYVANNIGATIVKVTPQLQVSLFSDSALVSQPGGIAIDGAGNLFCAMYGSSEIVRFRLEDGSAEPFAFDISKMAHPNDLRLSRSGGLLTTSRQSNLLRIGALGDLTVEFQDTNFGEIDGVSVPEDVTPCSGTFVSYGAGKPGSGGITPKLRAIFSPCPGLPIALEFRDFLGGAPAVLFLGVKPATIPLLGGTLLVDPAIGFAAASFVLPGSGAGNGDLTLPFTIDPNPAFSGIQLYFQAVAGDPGAQFGASFSNGLHETIGS